MPYGNLPRIYRYRIEHDKKAKGKIWKVFEEINVNGEIKEYLKKE